MTTPTSTPGPGPRRNPARSGAWAAVSGNVLMMGLVSFFTDASSEMIYPLLPVFLGAWPHPELWLGVMEGLAETTASLLKMFSGRLSDALGKRKALVVAGYGLSTVCRPLMALVGAPWQAVLFRFGDRIGKGVRTSPRDALIGESVGPEFRGLAFGFHRAMDHAGAVLGPVVAVAILLALLGYAIWHGQKGVTLEETRAMRIVFAVALVPGLLAMAALIFKVREIAPGTGGQGAGGGGPSIRNPKSEIRNPPTPDRRTPAPRLPRRFYWFVASVTLFALGNSSDLFILLYGKTRFGLGLLQILLLWIVLHLSKVAFSLPGGRLSDRVGRRPMILAGWFVYAAVYLGFAWAGQEWQFWALAVAYGSYYGLTEGAEKALVADFVSREQYGTAFGIYHGAVGIAALPASLIFGVLWKYFEGIRPGLGPHVAFTIGAVLAGLAAVMLVALISAPPKKPAWPAAATET